jgi:hypothetical protein
MDPARAELRKTDLKEAVKVWLTPFDARLVRGVLTGFASRGPAKEDRNAGKA